MYKGKEIMDEFFKGNTCHRCGKESKVFSMSIFNTDRLCEECLEKERKHPLYDYAKAVERQEMLNGNHNFQGIGKPEDL